MPAPGPVDLNPDSVVPRGDNQPNTDLIVATPTTPPTPPKPPALPAATAAGQKGSAISAWFDEVAVATPPISDGTLVGAREAAAGYARLAKAANTQRISRRNPRLVRLVRSPSPVPPPRFGR